VASAMANGRFNTKDTKYLWVRTILKPITVAELSKARNVFVCLNTEIVGSNLTGEIDVSASILCLFCPV
jgi:hypothetical protein